MSCLIFFIIVVSCTSTSNYTINDLKGIYSNVEGADHYTQLVLWEGQTFSLTQSPHHSDIWNQFYGHWMISNNHLSLYSSFNLDSTLNFRSNKDFKGDSLLISFDESLLSNLGDFKVKLSNDSMIWINPTRIKIDKARYYKLSNSKHSSEDKIRYYKHHPVKLLLWNKDYNFEKWYVFSSSSIDISLEQELPKSTKQKLVKYQIEEDTIISHGSKRILPNSLVKQY